MLPCYQNEDKESQAAYGILLVFITILAPAVAFYAVIEENKDDLLLLAPSSVVKDWVVRKCGTCWDGVRQVIPVVLKGRPSRRRKAVSPVVEGDQEK
jgi:hypothetical protein